MKITHFHPGDSVRMVSFGKCDLAYKRRLLSLGLTQGLVAKVIRFAPLGCPVEIEVRGAHLTLRKEEAAELIWEHA